VADAPTWSCRCVCGWRGGEYASRDEADAALEAHRAVHRDVWLPSPAEFAAAICWECARKRGDDVTKTETGRSEACIICGKQTMGRNYTKLPPATESSPTHREADIVINGVRLTFAQSMSVRVAVSSFLMELASDERDPDLGGQTRMEALGPIGPLYQARLSEVQDIIIDPLVRRG
jgi:hypothetical protein